MYDWKNYIPKEMVANPAQLDIPTADSPGRVPQNTYSISDAKEKVEQAKKQNPYMDLLSILQGAPSKMPIKSPVMKYGSNIGLGSQKQMRPVGQSGSLIDILSALYGSRFR